MRKKTVFIACAMLLLTGCGNTANETAAEVPVQEQTAVLESSETPETTETAAADTTAVSPPVASEEDYILYNPERNHYYDSRYMTWNPEKHDYDYASPSPSSVRRECEGFSFEEIPYEGTVPDALKQIFQDYRTAIQAYCEELTEKDPDFALVSRLPYEDDKGSYKAMCVSCLPYWDEIVEIATTDGEYRNDAQTVIYGVLWQSGNSQQKAGRFQYWMHDQLYLAATDMVSNVYGKSINAANVTLLQQTYGYMIAPALQDIGRLDLLQIDPESPCQDPEQLAEFARYFA